MKRQKMKRPVHNKREQAQSLVELAVSFMLIMFILAGAVDLGRAYFALIALRDAAQEGVIFASINPDDISGVETRVQNSSTGPVDFTAFAGSDIDLTWEVSGTAYTEASPPASPCAGFWDDSGTIASNSVTVTVEYDFPFTMPLISGLFPGGLRLRAADEHTILAPQCP